MTRIKPILGVVYYLRFFTAPKVWTGEWYECLLTDQRIRRKDGIISKVTGHTISSWPHEIYKPERFEKLKS